MNDLPSMNIAATQAAVCGYGVLFRAGSAIGVIWWENTTTWRARVLKWSVS